MLSRASSTAIGVGRPISRDPHSIACSMEHSNSNAPCHTPAYVDRADGQFVAFTLRPRDASGTMERSSIVENGLE